MSAYVAHPFYPEWKIRPGYGKWSSVEEIDGVAVHRVLHYVPRPPRGIRRLLSEFTFGFRLVFRRFAPGSIVVAVSPALFASALVVLRFRLTPRRPKLIVWVQDIYTLGLVETKEGGGLSTKITKWVEGFVLRSADRVVAIHPRFADYLVESLGVDVECVTVIRNWTHLKPSPEIDQLDARAMLGWPTNKFLAVHTGNMGAKQGLENVVEAARLADKHKSPIHFILVGDGGERGALEKLARGVESIKFVDPLNDEEYRNALAAADCLLVNELPGVATMAVPSKLTSYFDSARPILAATDPKGITAGEIEQASAGMVVAAGNPPALLAMALELSEDKERASAYGDAGRRYRTSVLDSDIAITAFEQLIREVGRRQ